VTEGSECEEDIEEETDEEEEKPIVRGKTGYDYFKKNDENMFINND
jgi:hypothetical protein